MRALSDTLLAGGCAPHVEAIHGETVRILSGQDAGRPFIGVVETEADLVLNTDLGDDPRAKIMLRFRDGHVPRLDSQGVVQTADGKKWNAVRRQFGSFLTDDFELKEITDKDQ